MSGCTMCEEKQKHEEPAPAHLDHGPARKAIGTDIGQSLGDVGDQLASSNRSAGDLAHDGFAGVGNELPDREFHEKSFGRSFANVRVYTDAAANKACRDLNARAYTVGNKIAFAESSLLQNKALVAHELTHVGQHSGEGPARKSDRGADDDGIDRSGEDEAERVEAAVDEGKLARSVLGDDRSAGHGDGAPVQSRQGPARKTKNGPWGAAFDLDATELKLAGSYAFGGKTVSMPIPGVPGLFAFFRPAFQAKLQGGLSHTSQQSFTLGVGVEGGIEGGVSLGECTVACVFLSVTGSAGGGFEFKQVGEHWHLQGEVKFETNLSFGVSLINGWALDYKKKLYNVELGKLTAIRVIGTYGKSGPTLDGAPGFEWGPEISALFNQFGKAMREVKRLAG